MRKIDWNSIPDQQDFQRPVPGGYIAVICSVDENEPREFLEIWWDFAEGPFKGANRGTFDRSNGKWWPTKLFRSYKDSSLSMFKAFKTAVEKSNPGYTFEEERVSQLVHKKFGVVLGEEEYQKKDGSIDNVRPIHPHHHRSEESISLYSHPRHLYSRLNWNPL